MGRKMQQQAPEQYRDAAAIVFAAYPSRKRSAEEIESYALHLADISSSSLVRAVTRVTDYHPMFPPSAGELKDLARKLDREARAGRDTGKNEAPYMGEPSHLAADNPYEKLALTFERQIQDGSFRGGEAFHGLNALIAGKPIAHDIETESFDFKMAAAADHPKMDPPEL